MTGATGASTTTYTKTTTTPDNHRNDVVVDEMNVSNLRLWASHPLSHITNQLFFAQLLYSKTHCNSDAIVLARSYIQHGQPSAAWKLIIESSQSQQQQQQPVLLQVPTATTPNPLFWSALEVAVTALAAMEDWTALQQLLQEITMECTTAHRTAAAPFPANRSESQWIDILLLPSPPPSTSHTKGITKKDDPSTTQTTTATNTHNNDNDRNVASRVWYWRGKAHWELGDPILATEYWSVALQWDPYNHMALQALLSYQLVTPQQAIELVGQLSFHEEHDEWLRALYLAQIPISCTSSSTSHAPTNAATSGSHPKTPLGNVPEQPAPQEDNNNTAPEAEAGGVNESTSSMAISSATQSPSPPFYYPPHQLYYTNPRSIHNNAATDSLDFGDTSSILLVSPPVLNVSSSSVTAATLATAPLPSRTNLGATAFQDKSDENHHHHPHRHTNNERLETGATTGSTSMGVTTNKKHLPSSLSTMAGHQVIQQAFEDLTNKYRLGQSPHVLALAARRAYQCYDWKGCLEYCEQLASLGDLTPTNHPSSSTTTSASAASNPTTTLASSSHTSGSVASDAAYCYITVLVLLNRHRTLFQLAHEWVALAPKSPQSWLAVGAYYYATQRYHVAQRHFCRATRLNPQCSPAWMAFGCSFAAVDESDQALASFRAAQRLSPGDPLPLLYMGVEYVRTNHYTLAQYFLQAAQVQSSSRDPLGWHEMGVLEYQRNNLDVAVKCFARALQLLYCMDEDDNDNDDTDWFLDVHRMESILSECSDPYWEATIFNLGHAYRKSRQFELAKLCYHRCLALSTTRSSGVGGGGNNSSNASNVSAAYAALAFATQLHGQVDDAIALYHQALASKPDDPFATEMLHRALRESMLKGIALDTAWENNNNHLNPFDSQVSPRATGRKSSSRRRPWTSTGGMLGASPMGQLLQQDESTDHHHGDVDDDGDDEAGSSEMDSDVDMSG